MIHRDHGKITFECDGCDELIETDVSNWQEAQSEFKAERWKAEKVGDEWTHLCMVCRRKSA